MNTENGVDDTITNEEVTLESIQQLMESHSHRDRDTIISMRGWLEKRNSSRSCAERLLQYKKHEHVLPSSDDGPNYEADEEYYNDVEFLLNDAKGG